MSKGRKLFLFIALPLIVIFFVLAFIATRPGNKIASNLGEIGVSKDYKVSSPGFDPWGGKCHVKETGRKELTVSPMAAAELSTVAPMGLTAGGHVTPIDHMYFYPVESPGNRFSAKVYAVADGIITSVQHRGDLVDGPADARPGTDEYRLTIEQTCNQGYYYDLITRLAPDIKKKAGTLKGYDGTEIDMAIKAGDLIGYVGNQSLDFGVYDTDVTLGFINPDNYKGEAWKIHTADAFAYFTKEAYSVFEPKILRSVEPLSGRIDYDKDGYLIGNWFEQGTNGYEGKDGQTGQNYWEGHLALLYDAYDPTLIIVSMGVFKGNDPQAFSVVGNAPDPGTVSKETGLVKYVLAGQVNYVLPDGSFWDRKTPNKGIKGVPANKAEGVALFQLLEPRVLKMEVFPGKTASEVTAFTSKAKLFER